VKRLAGGLALVVVTVARVASAQDDRDMARWNEELDRGLVSRPHTMAELEAGVIVLPSAPISAAQRGGNLPVGLLIGKGDATIQLGLHALYRVTPLWAVGAAVLFAPEPTTDTGYGLGGSSGLSRSHSRDYFYVGGEVRCIPLRYKLFEGWVGAQVGAIIIADRFATTETAAYVAPVGYPEVSERTEGLSGGLQAGVSYSFSESFSIGFSFRLNGWLLPSVPQCSAIGDCATLSHSALVYEGGLLLAYRLPL
jgi:hypothetical protein